MVLKWSRLEGASGLLGARIAQSPIEVICVEMALIGLSMDSHPK